jgi:signal transduction histidine kinase
MATSIRTRMLLASNLLVIAVGVAVGWMATVVATRDIERRVVDEPLSQAAESYEDGLLPRTDAEMLKRMGRILGGETAMGSPEGRGLIASSLGKPQQAELEGQLQGLLPPGRVALGGRSYRMGSVLLKPPASHPEQDELRFYLLVPEQRIAGATEEVQHTIAALTLAAVALATLVAGWISHTISRPIRQLATRMDRLSSAAADVDLGSLLASEHETANEKMGVGRAVRGPAEVARLTACYDRLLEQLTMARATLAQSARMATLGQMSASVAHELRNPLSGIKMNARVLADEMHRAGLDDESMKMIVREVDRMDAYLQELLGLAADARTPGREVTEPLRLEPVQLSEVAESVVALLAGRCRHSGVTVDRDGLAAAPAVRADAGKIRQVVLNLMLNALDAMPSGGRMTLSAEAGAGGRVRFSVSDTGGGVQVAEGTDIFEPFVSGKQGGTGLGLYVCRRIVRQHGGEIGYRTSTQGSTFWFEMPGDRS